MLNAFRAEKHSAYLNDIYTSQHLPNLIILAPNSKSATPEY
jgi:hypothetical protein